MDGRMKDERAETSGAAWAALMDYLKEAGEMIVERCGGDPVGEAEGCRFLGRLWASMRLFLIEQDPARPDFVPVMTSTRKFFADNPDTLYHRAAVREDLRYRVTGRRGDCAYLSFCLYAVGPEGTRIVSDLSDRDLETDADGRFEVILSRERDEDLPEGNWMKLEPGVRSLVVRQYYLNRERETPASYEISCESSPETVASTLSGATFRALRNTLERAVGATLKAGDVWSSEANTVSFASDAAGVADLFPTPDNQYAGGWFSLESGQGLQLILEPPDCRYWNVHLMSRWLESFDPQRGPVSLNKAQAVLEADGSARFVIAGRDPGVPNWLDTGGRPEGFFVFRWLQAPEAPATPQCRVIPIA